jgi:hypothetical protein
MTIAIDDISTTEQLDREALKAVRGGILNVVAPSPAPSPWTGSTPQMPSFPNCFPFNGGSPFPPAAQPTTQPAHINLIDPQNPLLQ